MPAVKNKGLRSQPGGSKFKAAASQAKRRNAPKPAPGRAAQSPNQRHEPPDTSIVKASRFSNIE